jgi:uncharacterized integral membrane protein
MGDEERIEHPAGGTPGERAQHMRELDKSRRARLAKIVVALVLVVLFILFIIRNSKPVSESNGVDFVFVTADARLIWVFLICGLLGGMVGYLLGRPSKVHRRLIREAERAEAPARGDRGQRPPDE